MSALDKLLTTFSALVDEYESTEIDPGPGEGNLHCVDCKGCYGCRFCVSCENCEQCTYCEGCVDCLRCTQSRDARNCEECTHTEHSRDCARSQYLSLCVGCEDCVQCFACVGLSGEEFCILNERYPRRDYFKRVNELKQELEARRAQGFRPAVEGLEWSPPEPEPEPEPEQTGAVPPAPPFGTMPSAGRGLPRRPAPSPQRLPPPGKPEPPAMDPGPSRTLVRGSRPQRPEGGPSSPRRAGLRTGRRPTRPAKEERSGDA